MSKHQTIKTIRQELEALNREIDLKIIRGFSYIRESRRHKLLMSQLNRLVPSRNGWFSRSLGYISTLVF